MAQSSFQQQTYGHPFDDRAYRNSSISPISTNTGSQLGHVRYEPNPLTQHPENTPGYPRETRTRDALLLDQRDEMHSIMASVSSRGALDSTNAPDFTQQKKPIVKTPLSWWWWWEIGATILSIASLVLLFILLSKSDDQRLDSWSLLIQPNSLIAVLTTVAKTSMMVPVASCLSQLKWRHFMRRSRPLDQFQVMDDASRGPWGSLLLLVTGFEIRALLPILLAFVTVVSLGFEPSAQQILEFPERTVRLTNISAEVGIATEYVSKAFVAGETVWKLIPTTDLFRLQSSVVDGISGAIFEPNFNCPSDYCTWEDFTTLGICSAYQNLTSEIKTSCDDPQKPLFNCTYMFPDGKGSTIARNITFGDVGKSQYLKAESFRSWFQSTAVQNRSGVLSAVKVTNYDLYRNRVPGIGFAYAQPPVTESYFARFYWCTQTFRNVTAIPRRLSFGSVDVEELEEKEYHIGDGCSCTTFSSPTGTNFTVDSTLAMYMMQYLQVLLTQAVVNVAPYSPRIDKPVDMANYLYTADFQNLTVNLATTLSHQIRSTNPGDNRNATTHSGAAYTKEIYIHVRWPWAILPTATVFITSVLLVFSVLLNTNHPLFKSSALALLFHGLDDNWPSVHIDQPETAEKVEHAAKGMRAHLATRGADSLLKFRQGTRDS
ncbi:hypothetical protein NUW58_g3542 [Xylaria curta]|uniref:Uncharacterized protein n=1 Tax=Xylaria curta TaxID=42375 RepID=A0ACC1PAH2_9PEZI|nr:hypothetical protein NUW58_g3542 [Xylaria curta]